MIPALVVRVVRLIGGLAVYSGKHARRPPLGGQIQVAA
jgi:hypothetical protein